jgi:hypothetical protein
MSIMALEPTSELSLEANPTVDWTDRATPGSVAAQLCVSCN